MGCPDDTDEKWEQTDYKKNQLQSRFYYAMRAKIQTNVLSLLCI